MVNRDYWRRQRQHYAEIISMQFFAEQKCTAVFASKKIKQYRNKFNAREH